MINVNKPYLPPLEKYTAYLDKIWESNILTNHGPLVAEMEHRLKNYLEAPNFLFLGNGTIALQIAIKALGLKGEIITTPFSYVATTTAILWENQTPVFADIEITSGNIDPLTIEKLITEKTSAILCTHVFGNPCNIEALENIAKKNNLKLIFDSAHCFGTKFKGSSVYNYGDISMASFHATKLFHTIEGGGLIMKDPFLYKKCLRMRNFGHVSPTEFDGLGINGKNSEYHAAMGLCVLDEMETILQKRKKDWLHYYDKLKSTSLKFIEINKDSEFNYAYFPVFFKSETELNNMVSALNAVNIFPRRYFYPSLNKLSYIKNSSAPVSEDLAARVLCLPLYHSITENELNHVCSTILNQVQ